MRLRPPNAVNNEDEALQVYQDDLAELTSSELIAEILRASRIAARDPHAFVWRGEIHVTAQQWADERVSAARALLRRRTTPKGTAWAR